MAAASREPTSLPCWKPTTAVPGQQLLFSFSLTLNTGKGLFLETPPSSTSRSTLSFKVCCRQNTHRYSNLHGLCILLGTHLLLQLSCPYSLLSFPISFPLLPFLPRSFHPPQVKEANKQKAIQGITRAEKNSNALQESL